MDSISLLNEPVMEYLCSTPHFNYCVMKYETLIKTVVLKILLLVCSTSIYGQDNATDIKNNVVSTFLLNKNTPFLTPYSFDTNFRNTIKNSKNYFYINNKSTGFNEGYYLNSKAEIQYPTALPSGLQRMNLKTDSFNPHGTPNLGAAVVLGMFDLFFTKK